MVLDFLKFHFMLFIYFSFALVGKTSVESVLKAVMFSEYVTHYLKLQKVLFPNLVLLGIKERTLIIDGQEHIT